MLLPGGLSAAEEQSRNYAHRIKGKGSIALGRGLTVPLTSLGRLRSSAIG
jgi:hypothetical protein